MQRTEPSLPLEEKLLTIIPKEYKSPENTGSSIKGMRALWGVFSGIEFERPGRGWEPVFSPDYTKFAYRAKMGGHEFIVIGDRKGAEFDEVRYAVFSPYGNKVAYAARQSKKWSSTSAMRKVVSSTKLGRLSLAMTAANWPTRRS